MSEKFLKVGNHFIRIDRIIRVEFDKDSVFVVTETDRGQISIPPPYCLTPDSKSYYFQNYTRKNTHCLFDISLVEKKNISYP